MISGDTQSVAFVITGAGTLSIKGNSTPADFQYDLTNRHLDAANVVGTHKVARVTTAQRNAMTATTGAVVLNTDVGRFQGFDGVGWADFGPVGIISTQEGVVTVSPPNTTGAYATLITLNQTMAAGEVLLLDAYVAGIGTAAFIASGLYGRISVNGTPLCSASNQSAGARELGVSLTARLAVGVGGLVAGANTIILEWRDSGAAISLNPATDGQGARLRLQRLSS